ncbi:hypothetical protein OSB04_007892, partial [Centaurea solstitialis]
MDFIDYTFRPGLRNELTLSFRGIGSSSMFALLKPTFSLPHRPVPAARVQVKRSHNDVFLETTSSELESKWLQVYDSLKWELIHDPSFEFDDHSRQWAERMLDYNVPGGKMNRGVSVVDSYRLLKGDELTDDEFFLSSALGWCAEWLQAHFLVFDDIMDESRIRRGQPCWFRLPEVGMTAVNDGVILRCHIPRILKKHFRSKAYYVDLLELFNEVEFQTASGQMIDLTTTLVGKKDLSKYSLSMHRRIAKYKSAYGSFYISVACALIMFGENLDDHVEAKDVLVEMGIYYQIQIGSDVENFKCSWLVVKALELANEEQKKLLHENYGRKDPANVAKVKELYNTLNLPGVFEDYENKTHEKLIKSIECHPSKAVQAMLKSLLRKIYKRH